MISIKPLPRPYLNTVTTLSSELFDNCHYDVCANQDNEKDAKKASCASLAHLATICATLGKTIDYKYREELKCG